MIDTMYPSNMKIAWLLTLKTFLSAGMKGMNGEASLSCVSPIKEPLCVILPNTTAPFNSPFEL